MQDFGIGYVFKTKICNKVQSNQLKQPNVNIFTLVGNLLLFCHQYAIKQGVKRSF